MTNLTTIEPTTVAPHNDDSSDAIWILTSAFIIFTMQSGFGLLEAGMVSSKNETNIIVKNAVDVIFGGLAYWMYGFAFSYGHTEKAFINPFTSFGQFFVDANEIEMGEVFAKYIFQLSFATTATTIVSGAMAERTNLKSYMLFSFFNTLSYCFPAHWIWNDYGFLKVLGAVDFAGCGPVHLVGGVSAIVATLMLGPRHNRFNKDVQTEMSSPTNVMLGTFMLWWGWLGFNCGSTFGISGHKWKLASRAAVVTINGSIGGSISAIIYSYYICKNTRGKLNVPKLANGILGGLVSITGLCAIAKPWEGLVIGFVGGIISTIGEDLIELIRIDDPVGCIPVHCLCAVWGLIAVGLFGEKESLVGYSRHNGVLKGGKWIFLLAQCATAASMAGWAAMTTYILLWIINKIVPIRISLEEEIEGADFCEHGIGRELSNVCNVKNTRAPGIFGNHTKTVPTMTKERNGVTIDLSFVNNGINKETEEATREETLHSNCEKIKNSSTDKPAQNCEHKKLKTKNVKRSILSADDNIIEDGTYGIYSRHSMTICSNNENNPINNMDKKVNSIKSE